MTKSEELLMMYHTALMKKHGILGAERLLTPLSWYISTGRASMDYIRKLDNADPKKVISILEQEGSVEDTLGRLKVLLFDLKR